MYRFEKVDRAISKVYRDDNLAGIVHGDCTMIETLVKLANKWTSFDNARHTKTTQSLDLQIEAIKESENAPI